MNSANRAVDDERKSKNAESKSSSNPLLQIAAVLGLALLMKNIVTLFTSSVQGKKTGYAIIILIVLFVIVYLASRNKGGEDE
jgi:L-asparagine transporter-like permease